KESKLVDTVSYKDLVPNREYKLVTKLVEWGNPNNVIATKTENFTPKSANGEYKVHLTVDGTKLRGKKVVFLEYLYDNEKPSEEQARHDNPKDEGQSVRFTNPTIGTKATFENGLKEMNPFKENVIVDTISYKDLVPNRKYRVVTKLVEADITLDSKGNVKEDVTKELDENVSVGAEVAQPLTTGKKATSVSVGTQTEKAVIYESEIFFTPKKKDGEYKVTIKIDGSKLRGKTLVFYEYLYDNEKPSEEQAKHENPKDEGQSVRLTNPKIGTQAYGYKGENHKLIQPLKDMTVTDKIKYEDLTIGRKYRVVTKLIEFGQPNKVIKEVESYFTPKEKDGFYYVSMKLDGLMLQGKKVTFMEYLYDNEKPSEEQAKHENPKDEGQTVEIAKPAIKTLATGSNGEKVLIGKGVQTIKEKAELTGLVVGQKYRVKVQAYFVGTTQGVAGTYAEKEFVAERSSMTFDWTFKVDVSKLGGKAISFTEILETENEKGNFEEVHRHNDDHKDKDQTIMIKQYLPKAGSRTTTAVVIIGFVLILMSVIIFAFLKSSKLD
ncbi:VaFE repeat-containing surface-anchored protein, partial [Enterococcus cecorum]|uniref:VaFE repeat-containing surface-anchored protein n=1 Tax=Enterococcus cecorum TaxID=44008 RepID=UPI00200A85ED